MEAENEKAGGAGGLDAGDRDGDVGHDDGVSDDNVYMSTARMTAVVVIMARTYTGNLM